MLNSWKRQFTLQQFSLIHDDPRLFIVSQWQRNKSEPNLKYLTYRTCVMLLFLTTWVISIINESGAGKWPIFLTNWGYTFCTLQALLACVILYSAMLGKLYETDSFKRKTLFLYPAYWLVNTMATSIAFAITIVYWSVIFDDKKMVFDAMNYFVHGNNSIMMFIDLWVVAHPIRLLHVVYTILFGLVYALFTLIYYTAGGTNKDGTKLIYKIVDWSKPGPTIGTCAGVITLLVVLHIIVTTISWVRRTIEKKCCSTKLEISMTETKGQAAYVNDIV